jgi:hypothetical protein
VASAVDDGPALAVGYVALEAQASVGFAVLIKISPCVWMDIGFGPYIVCGCTVTPISVPREVAFCYACDRSQIPFRNRSIIRTQVISNLTELAIHSSFCTGLAGDTIE